MKMKKRIAAILLGIVSAVVLFGFSGCKEEKQEQTEILHGFESVRELLTVYRVNVGKTELCEDKQYVSEGNGSMKVSLGKEVPQTDFAEDIVLAFVPQGKYFNKEIYSGSGYFAIDIYNPAEKEYELAVDVGNITTDFYTLSKGWNTITTDNFVVGKALSHYELTFRGQKGDSPSFYVDNFRYCKTSEEYEAFNFDSTKEVWLDFSHGMQKTCFELDKLAKPQSVFSAPQFSITRDKKYVASGTGALKVDFNYTREGTMDVTSFQTKEGMIFSKFNDYLGEGNWYLFFAIYNDYDYNIYAEVAIKTVNGESFAKRVQVPAKSWSNQEQSRLYLKEADSALSGSGINAVSVSYSFSGIKTAGSIYLDGIGIQK